MMRTREYFFGALLALMPLLVGCSSQIKVHERGWIGGNYAEFEVEDDTPDVEDRAETTSGTRVVLMSAVDHAPVHAAGMKPGDALWSINEKRIQDVDALYDLMESIEPGTPLRITILRNGIPRQLDALAGTERFERTGFIGFGLSLSPEVDLWPVDGTSHVLGIVGYFSGERRGDLLPLNADHPESFASPYWAAPQVQDGWRVNLALVQFGKEVKVIGQEPWNPKEKEESATGGGR